MHSTPHLQSPSLDSSTSSLPPSTPTNSEHVHRSVSLLGKIPRDLSSLIRSHSTRSTRRHSTLLQTDDDKTTLEYAANLEMQIHPDDERPARESKGRFYNFIHRSRSRSKHSERTPSFDQLPQLSQQQPAKPTARIQSRPFSPSLQRPTTPLKSPRFQLFGIIPLPSQKPKKMGFASRPNSPEPQSHDHVHLTAAATSLASSIPAFSSERSRGKMDFFRSNKLFTKHPTSTNRSAPTTPPAYIAQSAPSYSTSEVNEHGVIRAVSAPKRKTTSSSLDDRAARHSRTHSDPEQAPTIHSPLPIPTIIHTPATPERPMTSPPTMARNGWRKDSVDYRPMTVLSEEGLSVATLEDKGKGKEQQQDDQVKHVQHTLQTNGASTARKNRHHGSFDFERPGWSSRKEHSKHRQTVSSRKEHTTHGPEPVKQRQRSNTSDQTAGSSSQDHSHSHSHSTGGANSLGRSTGKKADTTTSKKPKTSSKITNGTSHGLFSFEPAVIAPVLTSKSSSRRREAETLEREAQQALQKERELELKELERQRKLQQEREIRRKAAKEAMEVSSRAKEKLNSNTGYRSAAKGRSLDLNLGFAWAPTKLREDALLPSSYGRTLTANRRSESLRRETTSRSVSPSIVAPEVAQAFRNALDPSGYRKFQRFVHSFDAHEIPIDGPDGIMTRVQSLLDESAHDLADGGKKSLLDNLFRVILKNA